MSVNDRSELDRALDKGALQELPPSVPGGFLGEVAPDLRKVDEFEPSLNAGLLQESTYETRLLTIMLLYLLVVTSPVAIYLVWRDRRLKTAWKVAVTALMLLGLAALVRYV